MKQLIINKQKKITIEDVWGVAFNKLKIKLSPDLKSQINKSRKVVEEIIDKERVVYGVNTGFGSLKQCQIKPQKAKQLQKNLIRSHAVGVGDCYSEQEARAIMFTRLISLSQGNSGVRLKVLEKIVELLNENIIPHIPSQGSVGCSGDLAPLSHMTLVLMGEGEILEKGKIIAAKTVLKNKKIKPIELEEKEGLALNNGTAVMTAIAALNIKRAEAISRTADVAGALSLEALMGTLTPFRKDVQSVRPHEGNVKTAKNFRALCKNSGLMKSHKDCDRIQDAYSLRCIPAVHGAVKDALSYCKRKVEIELNSTTDNPLIFYKTNEAVSAGNFHGEPIALVMDFLSTALADLGNISERRTFKMLTPELSEGLPPFLIGSKEVGLNSGLMIIQYTAASLVAENKVYAHPVSVDSIPTSANQEDHVSFGTIAANKAKKVVENLEYILAIELICSCQAAEFRKPLKLGVGTGLAYNFIRQYVKKINQDRKINQEINKVKDLIFEGEILNRLIKNKISLDF